MRRVTRDKVVQAVAIEPEKLRCNVSKIDVDYKRHIKEFYRIKDHEYFRKIDFNPLEIISEAFVRLADEGLQYDESSFFKAMRKVMSKENYQRIKDRPYLYKWYLKRINESKATYRKNVTDYYVRHLLSKKYSMAYIKEHPELIEEKRKQILNLRNNSNSPIENSIPPLLPGTLDLSILNEDYKGYAISEMGDFYSCKPAGRCDVLFGDTWAILKPRKGGNVRLNVRGIKKEISIKRLLEVLPPLA